MPGWRARKPSDISVGALEGAQVAIIAVTASAFDETRAAVLEAGANDFVSKPFRHADLFERIQGQLGPLHLRR